MLNDRIKSAQAGSVFSLADAAAPRTELIAETRYHLATRGYHVIEQFLTAAQCAALKAAYLPHLENFNAGDSERGQADRYHIHDLLARDIVFGRLLEDPRLDPLLEPMIGRNWIMYAFTTSSLPPGASNYGRRIHVDCPRFVPGYATNMGVIWALDDFTRENGGTQLLPGSHHLPDTPDEALFERHCQQVTCPAGSLIVVNARVYHRSGFNHSGQWRHALTMNICRPYMKQRLDWVRLIPSEIADRLNDRARRLIGYDTRLPTSLEEFFVPEEQRLYKANQEG
ncbi:MAG: phytanoyl-CoA dioxygenase family protein [Sphingomonadales bacterium]